MFVTAQVVDALLIAPSEFGKDVKVAAADEIEKRYLDTVRAPQKCSRGPALPRSATVR